MVLFIGFLLLELKLTDDNTMVPISQKYKPTHFHA